MDRIDVVLLISRWFHVFAAIIAVGGAAYLRIAFLPSAMELPETERTRLVERARVRWARVVHVCITLLLLTGGYNFFVLALRAKVEPMPYHAIFGLKLLAALAIFFIASMLVGRGVGAARFRQSARKWLTFVLVLAALVVLMSGILSQLRTMRAVPASPTVADLTP